LSSRDAPEERQSPRRCWRPPSSTRSHGAATLEGYPVETEGNRIPSANAYMGTSTMFERAGFEVVERRRANKGSVVRPIVSKTL
jgi:hypothetical protein